MANTQPTGKNKTFTIDEGATFAQFEAEDFGFADADGDNFAGIIISGSSTGKLLLDGVKPAEFQFIPVDQLGGLSWTVKDGDWGTIGAFGFRIVDDSNSENNMAKVFNYINFKVVDQVEKFIGTSKGETITGTNGRDIIDGKGGDDTLIGKGWKDTFVFSTGYGHDTIKDPIVGSIGDHYSKIDLSGLDSIKNFRDLIRNHVADGHQNLDIDGGNGDVLSLKNVALDDLDRGDFIF